MDDAYLALLRESVGDFSAALAAAEKAAAGEAATPHGPRRAAWLQAAGSDIAGAEDTLRRAAARVEDSGESWFAFGMLRLASDDHEAARHAFIAASRARHPPGPLRSAQEERLRAWNPEANRYAVFAILYDDFQHAFTCFLFPRAIQAGERQDYAFCAARACSELRHGASAAALLAADQRLNGEAPWSQVNLGHHHWLAERREQADAHYARARALFAQERLIPYHFNCGALIWLDRPASSRVLSDGAPPEARIGTRHWSWHFADAPARKPACVLLVGCDARFFDLYFPQFLLSVLSTRAPVAVHCHLADPTPGQVAFLEHAAAILTLSFSTSISEFREPAYYTCLRFMALPEVSRAYECGVLVTDIDVAIEPGFLAALPSIAGADFGLRMYSFDPVTHRQIAGEPWSIGAHPTYVANTETGRRFAGFLRDYIRTAYDPTAITNWTIDQCAIARGYDLLVRDRPDLTVLNFAFSERIARLAQEHPSKAAFLADRGVVAANFWDRALPFLSSGSSNRA